MRAVCNWTAPRILRRAPRAAPRRARCWTARGWRAWSRSIDKAAFTRADLVELVGALLPVDAPGDPRALIEQIVDMVGVRVSAPRDAHHREGHELFTVDAVIAEEARIFDMVDAADTRARLDVRAADLADLSADQARAIANIAALAVSGAAAASPGRRGQNALTASAARRRAPRQQRRAGARAHRQGGR